MRAAEGRAEGRRRIFVTGAGGPLGRCRSAAAPYAPFFLVRVLPPLSDGGVRPFCSPVTAIFVHPVVRGAAPGASHKRRVYPLNAGAVGEVALSTLSEAARGGNSYADPVLE